MNHLNYFFPYDRKNNDHEDQLTRAFLVLVRHVSLAEALFIDLVRAAQIGRCAITPLAPLAMLGRGPSTVDSQVSSIPESTDHLISVLLTDEKWHPKAPIEISPRVARYDGLVA